MLKALGRRLRHFLRHSGHIHIAEAPARTPTELVALFDRFLDERLKYGLEWDDFISWEQENPFIEAIRDELGVFEPMLFSKQPADRLIYESKVVELRDRVAALLGFPMRSALTGDESVK